MKAEDLPYRKCVGVMLLNQTGQVWIGRRVAKWDGDGSEKLWQMPQGGIDEGEQPVEAALRELEEEIGTNRAEIIGEHPDWLHYDLPKEALGIALKGRYRGQTQKWFAMRFQGLDRDVSIDGQNGHPVEFDQWRWEAPGRLPELVVPFKRGIYEQVVSYFQQQDILTAS